MTDKRKNWSQQVTENSAALELEDGVFTLASARKIAASLKRSADRAKPDADAAYRSAMSMLTFYINRAGKKLPDDERQKLETAKDELRRLYGRPARKR